jgi:hypothetical protein
MKKETVVVIACAVGIGVFALKDVFLSSDEKKIERLLDQIEESLELDEPLKPMALAGRLNTLSKLVAPDIAIEAEIKSQPRGEWKGFDSIKTGALIASRVVYSHTLARLRTDIQIIGSTAKADFQVLSTGTDSNKESFRERVDVQMEFSEVDSEWTVQSISVTHDGA